MKKFTLLGIHYRCLRHLIIIPLFFVSLVVKGATYYVKKTGNDSNTGFTDSQAWKTISKVNSWTFRPGDSILFKRGDEWREGIIVSNSGTTGSFITYSAYGTGNDPIINGSDIMSGWAGYRTNVWKTACASVIDYLGLGYDYVVIIDGNMFSQVATLAEVNTPNTYFVDKTVNPANVYIYSNSDPDTRKAEVSARMFGFYVNNKSFIKLSGLDFRNAAHSGVYFFGSVNSLISGNSIVDNCNFFRNRINGLQFYDGYCNNLVQNCSSTFNGNGYYSASYTNFGSNGNIFRNCYAGFILRYRVGIITDGHGFGIYNSDDCIVENSEAEHCFYGIIIDPNNKANDFICRYNYVHDTEPDEAGIRVGGDIPAGTIHKVYYNLIVNAGSGTRYPYAIAVGGTTRVGFVHLYNNTIFQDATSEHSGFGIFASVGTNLIIKNNILYSNSDYKSLLIIGPGSGFLSDNNCFFAPNLSSNAFTYNNNNYHTLASWINATGQDTHSNYGDPLFINNKSDWALLDRSPAINSGTNIGLTSDYSGNPIVGIPDKGAFEAQISSSIPLPVYLSSAIENSTPTRLEMTYNLSLANIVPATSAFKVLVNSAIRNVSSVAISGTKVLLTLASPVASGNVVTVAYTRPSSNPLQTIAGGQAATLSARTVTNKVAAPTAPVFSGAVIENATPSRVEMTYSLSLATILPATSAFTVNVNSAARTVSSVSISGTKVLITLSSPVAYGNTVTVAYTKPSSNPLQTTAGGQAATISAQTVTNKVSAPAAPVFSGAVIENATPSRVEMTYSLSLASILPAASAFAVKVNSVARAVSSVSISGTKVLLTLANPVAYGNTVTVAYTKPSANPLQTSSGGLAATMSAQTVTNKITAPSVPVFVSSTIENATPSKLEMIYSLSLANIVPAASAFTVLVNATARTVSSVAISGSKVILSLASPVAAGNVVTVSYLKPSVNPLQTNAGGVAATINALSVTNKVQAINALPVAVVKSTSSNLSGFVGELDATGSYDPDKDKLTYSWIPPANISVSSTTSSKIQFLGPIVVTPKKYDFTLHISDGKATQSKVIPVEILPYKPELEVAEILYVEASSFNSPYHPQNVLDGNIGTMWAANGDNHWLILELNEPFNIHHVKLGFKPGQKSESYFDILGSEDNITWDPILLKSASCNFSGDIQVFEFPATKADKEYKYVKLVGQSNSTDTWNYISEFKIYGHKRRNPLSYEELPVKLYPNPALDYVNIRIEDPAMVPDVIKIINLSGTIVYQDEVNPDIREFRIPINFNKGLYVVQLQSNDLVLFAQKLIVL